LHSPAPSLSVHAPKSKAHGCKGQNISLSGANGLVWMASNHLYTTYMCTPAY
jgi:hypothetical protein